MRTEAARNRQLEQADSENHKRGRDIEVGQARVILTSPNGTRYALVVSNAGALSTVAV
jgi:hypothetical protein